MTFKYQFFFTFLAIQSLTYAQIEFDYSYYKNFVRHSEGEFCTHIPPAASFVAYLNNDLTRILLENAPRWETGGDPNITGAGVFGVELGNFSQPSASAGDSIFMRFNCLKTGQQGILSEYLNQIPFHYFPKTLYLFSVSLPSKPSQINLEITSEHFRLLTWASQSNVNFHVYRRMVNDTVFQGQSRMQYELIAENLTSSMFLDTTSSSEPHGYTVIPEMSGRYGPHSDEVVDFPSTPYNAQAAVAYSQPFTVAVTWLQPGDTTDVEYRVYRSDQAGVAIDSSHLVTETDKIYYLDSLVTYGETYYYKVLAINSIGVLSSPSNETSVTVQQFANGDPDLDILHISRSPKYPRYEVEYDPPGYNPQLIAGTHNIKHYPDPGEMLKYSAIIRNSGGGTIDNFEIFWYIDSLLVMTENGGRLFPRQQIRTTIQHPWSLQPVQIRCEVHGQPVVNEVSTQNNALPIRSNALSFHFHAEKNILDLFEANQNPMGSYSFEDWAQFQVRKINQFFTEAVYPGITPNGVPEAVFLDTVSYYPNGVLPSGGTHAPHHVLWDGQWGFTGDPNAINYFQNIVLNQNNGMDWALLHELGHQIGLIDLYNMDIQESEFQVMEPRTGSKPPLTPIAWDVLYYCSRSDFMMHSNYQNGFSDHSAGALLRNLSKRRGYFGDYLADLPAENILTVRYPNNSFMNDAEIWIYQMQDNIIPNTPKFRGYTDSLGIYTFPHYTDSLYEGGISVQNPFSTIFSPNPHVVGTNSVLFLRVVKGDSVGYQFMDICDFNVAYWEGHTNEATFNIQVENWFIIPASAVSKSGSEIPGQYRLFQNYPNPSNPETIIRYHLPDNSEVTLTIYDILGRKIRVLIQRFQSAGKYSVRWNGRDDLGLAVSSGIYIYQLRADNFIETKKLILMR